MAAADKDKLATYSKMILFAQARLVSGMMLDKPAEISDLVLNYKQCKTNQTEK